jgi:predicted O-methyltransferase YrrM
VITDNITEILKEQELINVNGINEKGKYKIVDRKTGELLHDFIKEKNPKNVLEIGTSIGYSSIWIASALKKGAKLTTIDRWSERFEKALVFFKKSKLNINFIEGNALEIIPKLKEKFDVVFLDATKSEYLKYIELLAKNKKLNNDALILADNTISHADKMKDFLEFAEKHGAKTIKTKAGLTFFTM